MNSRFVLRPCACHNALMSVSPANRKFGVVAATYSPDIRQAARLAREDGFGGVQLDAYTPTMRLPDLSGSGRRELRHLLAAQEQELVCLRIDLEAKGLGPGGDVDRMLYNVDRAMEAASALGTPLLCVDVGPLPEPQRVAAPQPKVTAEQAGLIILPETAAAPPKPQVLAPVDSAAAGALDSSLSELGALADRYSVVVALRSDLSSFGALDDALRRVACPWFGVDLDPVAVVRDDWPMDDIFSRLGGSIRHVRARDAIGGTDRRTKPAILGRGQINWPQFLANLDEAAYAGWITLDPVDLPDRRAAAVGGLAHLRSL
jgi:sugar phosphate isomerase/epimerase